MERFVIIKLPSSKLKHTLIRFNFGVSFGNVVRQYFTSDLYKRNFYGIKNDMDLVFVRVHGDDAFTVLDSRETIDDQFMNDEDPLFLMYHKEAAKLKSKQVVGLRMNVLSFPDILMKMMFPGECILLILENVVFIDYIGRLYCTNYRIFFLDDELHVADVPLYVISSFEKLPSKRFKLYCKDFRNVYIGFEDKSFKYFREFLKANCFNQPTLRFSFYNRETDRYEDHDYNFDSPSELLEREGYTSDMGLWKAMNCNSRFTLTENYPNELIIPYLINNVFLKSAAEYRVKQRFPTYVWGSWNERYEYTGVKHGSVLMRCNRPHTTDELFSLYSGKQNNSFFQIESDMDKADYNFMQNCFVNITVPDPVSSKGEKLEGVPQGIFMDKMLVIIDTGSRVEPLTQRYKTIADIKYYNLPTYQEIRDTYNDLNYFITESEFEFKTDNIKENHISGFDSWNNIIQQYSDVSRKIIASLTSGNIVIIQDAEHKSLSSSLLSSLVQVMIDPYYRTIKGFCNLIQKEWLDISYSFEEELFPSGYKNSSGSSASIFLFIYSVWNVRTHFPHDFEFKDSLLVFILDSFNSNRFVNFSMSTLQERKRVINFGSSIWKYISQNEVHFLSPFFKMLERHSPLKDSISVNIWYAYYFRYHAHWNTKLKKMLPKSGNYIILPNTYLISDVTGDPKKYKSVQLVEVVGNFLFGIPPLFFSMPSLHTLNLSNNFISAIPDTSDDFNSLTSLNLSNNSITSLSSLRKLSALVELDVSFNYLESIPSDFFIRISSLRKLNLQNNKISEFPPLAVRASNLLELDVSSNKLSNLGRSFEIPNLKTLILNDNGINNFDCHLPSTLTKLNLENNNLVHIPPHCFEKTKNIKLFSLSHNSLFSIPESITLLESLSSLNLSKNEIQSIPASIGFLRKLKVLDLSYNRDISELPRSIGGLRQLQRLYCKNTSITNLPVTICLLENLNYIEIGDVKYDNSEYYNLLRERSRMELEKTFRSYRSQLMFVGDVSVGKSAIKDSLCRKWKTVKREKTDSSISFSEIQEGISTYIRKFTFEHSYGEKRSKSSRRNTDSRSRRKKSDFEVRIWDFGEHSVASQHFFFNDRAIYCIVFKCNEDSHRELNYWLESLRVQFPNAKVVLIANQVDLVDDIDKMLAELGQLYSVYQRRYSSIKFLGIYAVSAQSGLGIDNLRLNIENFLTDQYFVGKETPRKFALFEEILSIYRSETNSRVITKRNLFHIAGCCGITNEQMDDAIKYLVHFGSVTSISTSGDNIICLDPNWLSIAVYELFNSNNIFLSSGILYHSDAPEVWQSYSPSMYGALLSIMEKYGILVVLNESQRENLLSSLSIKGDPSKQSNMDASDQEYDEDGVSIIPSKLSSVSPYGRENKWKNSEYSFHVKRKLVFNFVPAGFFSKLTVYLLNVFSPDYIWLSGFQTNRLLIENNFGDAPSSEKAMIIHTRSNNEEEAGILFFLVYDLLIDVSSFWMKLDIEEFAFLEPMDAQSALVPLEYLQSTILEGKDYVEEEGKSYQIINLAPEISLKGDVVNYNDIVGMEFLGEGGYASVYKGEFNGRNVAVKQLFQMNVSEAWRELHAEVTVQSLLDHPSIVKLIGISFNPFCTISELIPYGDLGGLILDLTKEISFHLKLKFLLDINDGLNHMHTHLPPIAHLDLKTPNILVNSMDPSAEVCAKLTDFGTSKFCLFPLQKRQVDNPAWLAPEIIRGELYDQRADIYSLGIIFWELLCRDVPFSEFEFGIDIEEYVLSGGRPSLPEYCPVLYSKIACKCWSEVSKERPTYGWIKKNLLKLQNSQHIEQFCLEDENYFLKLQKEKQKAEEREKLDESKRQAIRHSIKIDGPEDISNSSETDTSVFLPSLDLNIVM
eukprot:TRINITY_DN5359_c0_g1_i1.p1 TRINITY_DN5359_c0_g1~~TRINITY_DN5359_c0_g1_i1.p1  ORF type:complete len:1884 (+),score=321.07 TRINITY_DN5359_c0_g1_i1:42-5654(+)